MKRFYLAGQRYFGNRGCEALVRATSGMLNEQFGKVEILCPSDDPDLDRKQWPQSEDLGLSFVRAVPYPASLRWWYRTAKRIPALMRMYIPHDFSMPPDVVTDVRGCDAVIMIGGDNITLDYSPAGLIGNTAFSEVFMKDGMPTALWAASVGPFSRLPPIEHYMADFLNRLNLVTVREPISLQYLAGIGVTKTVKPVADPAFLMVPEPFDTDSCLPQERGAGVLGLNFSPLVRKFGREDADPQVLLSQIDRFVRDSVSQHDLSVVLVPHVDPLNGSLAKSDSAYMAPLFERLASLGPRVAMAPRTLNAAQLKYLISQCRFFMGARTHSTIAGFSMGVPTSSIAYSVKARGLNMDIFGHERYVIPTRDLSGAALGSGLELLIQDEAPIRERLASVLPDLKRRARLSGSYLADCLAP